MKATICYAVAAILVGVTFQASAAPSTVDPPPSSAQSAPGSEAGGTSAQPSRSTESGLQEVIVTAQKRSQN